MSPMYNPAHPGCVLRDAFKGKRLPVVAQKLSVSQVELSHILKGSAPITAELSDRLSAMLGTSDGFWMKMQAAYDAWHTNDGQRTLVNDSNA